MTENWDPPRETLVPYYANFPLRVLLRRKLSDIGDVGRASLHESVKARLFQVGRKLKLQPLPEYPVNLPGRRGKVDMVFATTKKKKPLFALEIDGTIRYNSILKLKAFPAYTAKWVISTSKNLGLVRYRRRERLDEERDIHHFVLHEPD